MTTTELSLGELLDLFNTNKLSADDLLERVQSGSKPAFEALYSVYSSRFYWYLRKRWQFPHEDAEELVDDVFLLVFKSVHRFDPKKGSALGLMWTICYHAAINKQKKIAYDASHKVPLPTIDGEDTNFASLPLEEQLEIAKLESAIAHCWTWSFETLSLEEQEEITKGRGRGRYPRPAWSAARKRFEEALLACRDETVPDWRGNQ